MSGLSTEVVWKECSGEAHQPGNMADHCMVCLPFWGSIPTCPKCHSKLHPPVMLAKGVYRFYCQRCRRFFFSNRGS